MVFPAPRVTLSSSVVAAHNIITATNVIMDKSSIDDELFCFPDISFAKDLKSTSDIC